MSQRLPVPGGDDNDWGDILNGFLGVSLNTDGTLLSSSVSTAGAEMISNKGAASGYAPLNTYSLVPVANLGSGSASTSTYLRGDGSWQSVSGGASNATTSTPGLVQLAGDLGGSGTAATAPTLANTSNVQTVVNSIIGSNATVSGALQKTSNLSDVSSATTARSNLSAAQALVPTAVKTSAYTAAPGDFVPVDTSGGSVTITLPSAPADKSRVEIKMINSSGSNTVTINTGGSDVFNKSGGTTTGSLSLLNQALMIQYASSGGIWYVQSDDLPLAQTDARYVGAAQTTLSTVLATQPIAVAAGGGAYSVTLTQNTTLSFSGAVAGTECAVDLQLTQDSVGGRTVTWPGSVTWLQGVAPTLPTGPGQTMLISLVSLNGGTTWYGSYAQIQSGWPGTYFQAPYVGGSASRTHTANSLYVVMVPIPATATITGIMYEAASTVSGNMIASLFSPAGTLLVSSASSAEGSTNVLTQIPFSTPYTLPIGGLYPIGIQFSSATATTYDVYYASPSSVIAQGSFTAPGSITVPTATQTSALTPIISTY